MGERKVNVMELKERVRRAEYTVDADVVAEAIVRRMTENARRACGGSFDGVPETLEPLISAKAHA
jgi:hypothetical protein